MIYRGIAVVVGIVGIFVTADSTALAQEPDQGLTITPLREQIRATAGASKVGKVMISNRTSADMVVDMSVEKFSVKNKSYEYVFGNVDNEWVQILADKQLILKPNEEREVTYRITVPAYAPSGGYYYTILASMNIPGVVTSELRVASLLYLTVDGSGIARTATVGNSTLPELTMTPQLAYTFTAENTGNVHVAATGFSEVRGLFTDRFAEQATSLLMPKTDRILSGSAVLPWIPGVYEVTYGFTNEKGDKTTATSQVVYVPLWCIIALTIAVFAGGATLRKRRTAQKK